MTFGMTSLDCLRAAITEEQGTEFIGAFLPLFSRGRRFPKRPPPGRLIQTGDPARVERSFEDHWVTEARLGFLADARTFREY